MTKFICLPALLFFLTGNGQDDFKAYSQSVPGTSVNFKMMPIPEGKFKMGSPENQKGHRPDESPQKEISISPFWMAALETTHDEFGAFWTDQSVTINSSVDAVTRPTSQYIDLSWGMGKDGGFPVNSMSQTAALMYCHWLYKKTGIFYRLPTEAEWEYACRAGSGAAFPWGDDPNEMSKYAWFKGNSKSKYQKTGTLQPNAWGLYDMLGNVAEWTLGSIRQRLFFETHRSRARSADAPAIALSENGKRVDRMLTVRKIYARRAANILTHPGISAIHNFQKAAGGLQMQPLWASGL